MIDFNIAKYIDINDFPAKQLRINDTIVWEKITPPSAIHAIKFESENNEKFILKWPQGGKTWDGTLQYSYTGTTWNTWNGADIYSYDALTNKNRPIYIRGTGNTGISEPARLSPNNWSVFNTIPQQTERFEYLKIHCTGNIENILDYQTVIAGNHPTMSISAFFNLFNSNIYLVEAPELPATVLTKGCYQNMFQGCISLVSTPELPAIYLEQQCYQNMFSECYALVNASELPSLGLRVQCYDSMFKNCTSLVNAPSLPASILSNYCYSQMFSGCVHLTNIEVNFTEWGTQGLSHPYTWNWLYNVSSTGTFKCKRVLPIERGGSLIPENWTVEYID